MPPQPLVACPCPLCDGKLIPLRTCQDHKQKLKRKQQEELAASFSHHLAAAGTAAAAGPATKRARHAKAKLDDNANDPAAKDGEIRPTTPTTPSEQRGEMGREPGGRGQGSDDEEDVAGGGHGPAWLGDDLRRGNSPGRDKSPPQEDGDGQNDGAGDDRGGGNGPEGDGDGDRGDGDGDRGDGDGNGDGDGDGNEGDGDGNGEGNGGDGGNGDGNEGDGDGNGDELNNENRRLGGEGGGGLDNDDRDVEDGDANELETDGINFSLDEMKLAVKFKTAVAEATLDNGFMGQDAIHALRNPPEHVLQLGVNTDEEKGTRASIQAFLSMGVTTEDAFNAHQKAITDNFPDIPLLSYHSSRRLTEKLSGVSPMLVDMCPESCMAYTGPWADKERCEFCQHARYKPPKPGARANANNQRIPYRQFPTLPLGPQLQAIFRDPDNARSMKYRARKTQELLEKLRANPDQPLDQYDDVICGMDYLQAASDAKILEDDIVCMMSLDGAQIYQSKQSDCWFYIWIIIDHHPSVRYKKENVLIGGFIPGPNKPKNLESFLLPGIHHFSALSKEGLPIWDSSLNRTYLARLFLLLVLADCPGMALISGTCGYKGRIGCRLFCGLIGRHLEGCSAYYTALLKPTDYNVNGCDHDDIQPVRLIDMVKADASQQREATYNRGLARLLQSQTQAEFKRNRRSTGICRPSIISGIPSAHRLPLPSIFGADIMHLLSINNPEQFVSLWRGKFRVQAPDSRKDWVWAVLVGKVWTQHGADIAAVTPYLPTSFDRPPRNPALKISSGYKAWEYLLYVSALCPAMLINILPPQYLKLHWKFARIARLICQHCMTSSRRVEGFKLAIEFCYEFERYYTDRLTSRLHFIRPTIHLISHLFPDVIRVGSLPCSSQWTMERVIGDIGRQLKQHNTPYANLAQRCVAQAQATALVKMIPGLRIDKKGPGYLPKGARDIGDGYVFLRALDPTLRDVGDAHANALSAYATSLGHGFDVASRKVRKWARLRLPNGQIARSQWKECEAGTNKTRRARFIKVDIAGTPRFGEALFYFIHAFPEDGIERPLAMVALYSLPDKNLLKESFETVYCCELQGDAGLVVVKCQDIRSVIAMIPFPESAGNDFQGKFFVCEKPGLDIGELGGYLEPDEEDID